MVQKYFLTAFLFASLMVVSCRQDDEMPAEDFKENNLSAKEIVAKEEENTGTYSKDSTSVITPTDPPKNGTHWKLLSDSTLIITDETTDPPKNGTHWRGKN